MKKLLVCIALVFLSAVVVAQDEETPNPGNGKLFAGGSLGLSFGNYTLINLSPQIGYRFNKYLASGLGFNLIYASQKDKDFYGRDFSKSVQGITGLNLFTRFYPVQKFFIQLQPEANYIFGNITYYQGSAPGKYKLDAEIVPSFLAGGGLVVPTGNGALITTVMYDVLQRLNSPYGNKPIVNVGYNFNF
ncbi:MAG TPA: hypothetical protein VEY10_20380 [Flavisolibacter sp.]|jgi:hypothetical protein|nr:hypothetical protein [Flavisolibacter sp.]